MQPLGALRGVVHELRQSLGRRVAQPFFDRQPVALRLADLLRVLIQEQFVGEGLRRLAAQDAADPAGQPDRVDQVLARHLVVDAQRIPAHRPVGFPLQLATAAGHAGFECLAGVRVAPDDGAGVLVALLDRHLHHHAGARVDRQDRRIGGAPLRPEGGQYHRDDLVEAGEDPQQRRVEAPGGVILRRGRKFVLEPESVEERPQPGIVVRAEAVVRAERVGNASQRFAQMPRQHLPVRDVVRHLAQPIHIIAEGEQAGWQAGEQAEGVADPRGAGDLAKRADMRQARWTVAGLEQRFPPAAGGQPARNFSSLLERPGFRDGVTAAQGVRHPREAR